MAEAERLLGLPPGGALSLSYERLQLAVAAEHRVRASATLEMVQGIASGVNGGNAWKQWQERIIKRIKS